jgi:hypothetical protein
MIEQVSQHELKNMLAEASLALAHLGAERLEEMALSCVALVRDTNWERRYAIKQSDSNASARVKEMAIFARVLEATEANLKVIRRICDGRPAELEYVPAQNGVAASGESEHGDH